MNTDFIKMVLLIPGIILTFETIAYNILFCIVPSVVYRLGVFEYSMAVTNFDLNKVWLGFICFSLFMANTRLSNKRKQAYEIVYICS